jgi:hypothetical protein
MPDAEKVAAMCTATQTLYRAIAGHILIGNRDKLDDALQKSNEAVHEAKTVPQAAVGKALTALGDAIAAAEALVPQIIDFGSDAETTKQQEAARAVIEEARKTYNTYNQP